jgi:hypothetical protein
MGKLRRGLLLLALVTALSCGGRRTTTQPVSGKVTFDGEALPSGILVLVPADPGMSPDSGEIRDGVFAFEAKPGLKTVQIRASREAGKSPMGPVMREYLPARYNSNSTLKAEVKADGPSELDFTLTSKAP